MSPHRAIVEAGPGAIRQLCCGTGAVADAEAAGAALDAIDDPVALVAGRPVAVDSAWRDVLRSLGCDSGDGAVVVHPSWWPPSRIDRVTAAAAPAGDVLARPRSWLLRQASNAPPEATVVVEIAERLVAINGADAVAVPRTAEPKAIAREVAGAIERMAQGATVTVVIDVPNGIDGAAGLASSVATAVRGDGGGVPKVVRVDGARLSRIARSAFREPPEPAALPVRSRAPRLGVFAAAAVTLATLPLAISAVAPVDRHGMAAAGLQVAPATYLVEGRVALSVPANWPTQRVLAGPGSARVQVTSPSDPEVALHVTQSPVAGEALSGTAERLKRGIDAEPAGVFVDFDPSGATAGRPAVTYRELRPTHHVRWTVFVDGPVRISIGCQSRPGGDNAVREACEQAVRSARTIG
ncbi:type VII secretion-associated protein [Mycobacterium saskatchewanense]|uniref:Type VII secretion-associated protein n=1 Tax=Mycobacterium saskatchewanense TaxID=220927 RepID=A0AAJ3NRC0_9MYCO|nr:type VII secretion-associated protein [Mycobacterium saskatchewanense]ORW72016.1 Type VII secretion-associated protein [Mycobacterium saskatchewanense]BBX65419.1 type VII secretion-associated protein [Mycobacterium saskatchewanense]